MPMSCQYWANADNDSDNVGKLALFIATMPMLTQWRRSMFHINPVNYNFVKVLKGTGWPKLTQQIKLPNFTKLLKLPSKLWHAMNG